MRSRKRQAVPSLSWIVPRNLFPQIVAHVSRPCTACYAAPDSSDDPLGTRTILPALPPFTPFLASFECHPWAVTSQAGSEQHSDHCSSNPRRCGAGCLRCLAEGFRDYRKPKLLFLAGRFLEYEQVTFLLSCLRTRLLDSCRLCSLIRPGNFVARFRSQAGFFAILQPIENASPHENSGSSELLTNDQLLQIGAASY